MAIASFSIRVIHEPTVYDHMVCRNLFAEKRLVTVSIKPAVSDIEPFQKSDVVLTPLGTVKDLFDDEILMIKEDMFEELSVINFGSDDDCCSDSESDDDCGSESDSCSEDPYIAESGSEWALMF